LKTISVSSAVLVVDDDEAVRKLLTEAVTAKGMQVFEANTGERAIEMLQTRGVGCLIVDKNLPGVDGLEVMRLARKNQPYCATIMMTAFASTESAIEALRLGATDYIPKPFADINLTAEVIENAIDHHRAMYERDKLVERLREYQHELGSRQGELDEKRTELKSKQTEIDTLNDLLASGIGQATDGLVHGQRRSEVEQKLLTVQRKLNEILNYVQSSQRGVDVPTPAVLDAVVERVQNVLKMARS